MTAKKLLFVVNVDWFFVSHRLPIALAAINAGYEVHLACAVTDKQALLEGYGIFVHPLTLSRNGMNPFNELLTLCAIYHLLKQIKPDLVHLVTIKPVLYAGIAARLARVPAVVASISGLGFIFMSQGVLASLRKKVVAFLYRAALNHQNIRVIFQNPDDRAEIIGLQAVTIDNSVLIRGSGVDLKEYVFSEEPEGIPVVILLARMLKDKGIFEYVEAIRLLKGKGVVARFLLVGGTDSNPSSISQAQLESWTSEGIVEWLGFRSDVVNLLTLSNLVVLPSYREGLPKTLIEAAAIGRAVITTDVPGCRDAIEPNVSGLLVPVKNIKKLADAMGLLLCDTHTRQQFAKSGRRLAEQHLSVEIVIEKHMLIYKNLLA